MMTNKYTDVSFHYVPSDEECNITGAEIARELGIDSPQTIYDWAKEFSAYLSIKKVDGRWKFSRKSLDEFRFIQSLRKKDWSWKQIRGHLEKRGFEYAKYDSGLINPKDPMGYEALAIQISMKTQKTMQDFLINLEKTLDKRDEKLLKRIDERILNGVSDEVNFHMLNIGSDIKTHTEETMQKEIIKITEDIEKIKTETLNSITDEFSNNSNTLNDLTKQIKESHEKDIEMIQKLRNDLEEKHEQQQTKKGFNLFKWFAKK